MIAGNYKMKTMYCLISCLVLLIITKEAMSSADAATNQLVTYNESRSGPVGFLSTSSGMKIDNRTAYTSLDRPLLDNSFFTDSVIHIVHERTAERPAHAKGAGGFGSFEVTHDVSDICKAAFLSEVGKKTPVAVRFSQGFAQSGAADSVRDSRGFAVKFYTEDGNYDLLTLQFPVFSSNDPINFASLMHAAKRNPATHLPDQNMLWDFAMQHPESFNIFIRFFGDEGIPNGYRYMPGFGVHTFQVVNNTGDSHFVRFYWNPDLGIQNLRTEDASSLAGQDPDSAIRDLYNAIAAGNYPTWTLSVQVLSSEDVKNAGYNVFDSSRTLSLTKYPLRPVGTLVLNKNPLNHFAEMEQLAFNPGNLVPGILGSPEKLYQARVLAYRLSHIHRLGVNFNNIKVNQPLEMPYTVNRDGVPPVNGNEWDTPSIYPNSFNGVEAYVEQNKADLIQIDEKISDNMDDVREVYNELTDDRKTRLIENIVGSLGLATKVLQERVLEMLTTIDSDLGLRVQEGLQANTTTTSTITPLTY